MEITYADNTTNLISLHDIRDKSKLQALIASMSIDGWQGRPILAIEIYGSYYALTGTHRITAARHCDIDIPMYVISGNDHILGDNGHCVICASDECTIANLLDAHDDDERIEIIEQLGDVGAITIIHMER